MLLLERLGERIMQSVSWDKVEHNDPSFWGRFMSRVFSSAGVPVTAHRALGLSVYYACAHNKAEDLAKMPLVLNRRLPSGGKEKAKDHYLYNLLRYSPNERMGSFSFRETLTFLAQTWHGGFAYIQRNGRGDVMGLYPIHSSRVVLDRQSDGSILYKIMMGTDGQPGMLLRDEDVFHIHAGGPEGDTGYSQLELHAQSVGIGLAAQEFAAAFYRNGSNLSGVFTIPQDIKQESLDLMKKQIKERSTGRDNWMSNMVLYGGMQYQPISIPPDQAQFIESRQFQVEEICRWFRMPPSKVQQTLRAEGWSTLEQKNVDYYTDALMPWDVRWQQEIWRKLLTPAEREEYFAEHLFDAVLRVDQTSQVEIHRKYLEMGVETINEIREMRNMTNIGPDGDKRWKPVNLETIDTVKQPAPVMPPQQAPNNGEKPKAMIEPFIQAISARIAARQAKSKPGTEQAGYMAAQLEPFGFDASEFIQSYLARWFAAGVEFNAADATAEITTWLREKVNESTNA